MQHVFIIGSKGIPGSYGGFETFVDNLVTYKKNDDIQYYVACTKGEKHFEYQGAKCFRVDVPQFGAAKAVLYDIQAFRVVLSYINKEKITNALIYVLACRIGPFFGDLSRKAHKLGARVYVNPDGHEWLRAKWNKAIQMYWKISENLMVKHADLLVCDSMGIESYIREEYKKYNPKTTYIAYGVNEATNAVSDDAGQKYKQWLTRNQLMENNYYLMVGRFVPENNYATCIKEYMSTNNDKPLVIISNVEQNKFYEQLKQETKFDSDNRIKFVGTIYDKEVLALIRQHATAYLHGHEVGGTNPSLLEALASTKVNLLYDVVFNREVGKDASMYFTKEKGSLRSCIEIIEKMGESERDAIGERAKARIAEAYSMTKIVGAYEDLFGRK